MVLYTIVPEYLIFPTTDQSYPAYETVIVDGVSMMVRRNDRHQYEVIQLLSTNPDHYLRFTPGQEIIE